MEKIASFTIDHNKLQPGIYVSRKDHIGAETITTFDLRMTSPNEEPRSDTALPDILPYPDSDPDNFRSPLPLLPESLPQNPG